MMLDRVRKAARMLFPGPGGWGAFWWPPAPNAAEFREARETPWRNDVVSIALSRVMDNFAEPEPRVSRLGPEGNRTYVPFSSLIDLLENPNPYYDGDTLWMATVLSYLVDGNAYWIKARGSGGGGRTRELYWAPHWMMNPEGDERALIRHFAYRVNGRRIELPISDVVHFRFGVDPENSRVGYSRLKALLHAIYTDTQTSRYTAAIFRNFGVPAVVLKPKDGRVTFRREQREELKELWRQETTGANRGGVVALSGDVEIEKVAYSPEELGVESLRRLPEARICAALNVSPMFLDLPSGLERSTYSNKEEARRGAYHDCLIPMGKRFARTINRQLLGEMAEAASDRFEWDYSGVKALAEDEDRLYRRLTMGWRGGWLKRSEARSRAGWPVTPSDDIYISTPVDSKPQLTVDS